MREDAIFLHQFIDSYPDWPVEGTTFRDLTRLYQSAPALHEVVSALKGRYINAGLTHVAAIEARGFIVGGMLAGSLNLPLVLVRKGDKLAGSPLQQDVEMNYGTRTMQLRQDACDDQSNVVIFDDLVATGGSVLGASTLLKELGATIHEIATVAEIPDHGGRDLIGASGISMYSLMAFEA